MADQLKNILSFTVAAGDTVAIPHNLNEHGHPLIPDRIEPDVAGLELSADNTNVTAHNPTGASITSDVLCEAWHTIEREFGPKAITHLIPQPFVALGGNGPIGGGGGGAPTPATLAYFYDDFITGQALVGVISGSITASITVEGDASSIDLINDPDTQSIGVIDLHSQASEATNASAAFSLGGVAIVKFGSPTMPTLTQEWRVKADAAPTALSDFFLAIGLTDTPTYPLAQGAGPLFLAGFAEFGNGNWWISSQGAPFSAGNCVDTGMPVTTNWTRLTIVIQDGDTQMYFIDGVQVGGTQTNDLESLEAGIAIQIRTPDGTKAHSLFADYVLCTYPIIRS